MEIRKLVHFCGLFLLLLGVGASPVFAQGTDLGAIGGTVTDASGALVPGAAIVVTDQATHTTRSAQANDKGEYAISGLNSGRYQVRVSAPGFASLEVNGVVVEGSSKANANAVLQISTTNQAIEVTAENARVDTEDQTISNVLNSQAVTELPRDSRDVYSFLYLNPNITQADASGNFKFLGAQSYGASFSLDGQRSNGGIFGDHTQSEPSLEAVDEVKVQSSDFSAEYAGIANIRITTKRGTDQYHGSVIYNNKNSALAAWTLQDKDAAANFAPTPFQSAYPNPKFNINDLGGSFGGRVPKMKETWFFLGYERDWTVQPSTIYSNNMPHPTFWTGDFSLISDSRKPDVPGSVSLTPQEIAANTVNYCSDPEDSSSCGLKFKQIPQRLLNPTVQQLIGGYFPKIGVSAPIDSRGRVPGFATLLPGYSNQDLGTVRLDHNFSDNDRTFVAYNVSDQSSATSPVVSPFTGLGLSQNDRLNHTVSASYTKILTPSMVNEARGGFNQQNLFRHSNTTLGGFLSSIGFGQDAIDSYGSTVGSAELNTYGQTQIAFGNTYQTFTNGGRNTDRPQNQNLQTFGDTLTWMHGTHNFRMGGDAVRNQADDGFTANRGSPRGALSYVGSNTTPFADFLLGLPPTTATFIQSARPPMNVYDWETGYFFQDDWKITSRLTLNLGLRYELDSPFIEQNDLMVNLNPDYKNATTGQQGILVIPSNKTLKYLDPRLLDFGYETASQAGVGRGLVHLDKNDWAPRIGFAWRLSDKNVLRGGWGFYYPTPAAQGMRDALASSSFNEAVTVRNTLQPWPTSTNDSASPISGGTLTGFGNQPSINAIPFNLRQPRVQQYNVTFERDLGWNTALRLSYLGTTMHGLIAGQDLDVLAPNNTAFGTTTGDGVTPCDPVNNGDCALSPADLSRLPFPTFGDYVMTYKNFGHGQSNAFQAQVEHRLTNGLMFSAAYTLQDEKSSALDTANSSLGGIAYNPFNPSSDYGEEAFVSRHRFVGYGIYDLPVGRNRKFASALPKWADAIVGGWQTTFNLFAKSGTGFTPFWVCDDCSPIEPGNVAVSSIDAVGDFNGPSFRPVVTSKNFNQHVGDSVWNSAAFAPPSVGSDLFSNPANATRNMLWGPGTWGVNLGVHKNFHFTERVTAQLGADIDNLFNHPLLSPDFNAGGGGGNFAKLGDFNLNVDQATGKLLPITDVTANPDFGRLINSFPQEGIDSRRSIRLRLRITF